MANLTIAEISSAAKILNVEPCVIKAVVDVESSGSGFLSTGQIKILFEGHIFWKELKKRGTNPEDYALKYPNVVYPKWDKSQYLGGLKEHDRLAIASEINREAALCSASYGLFQVMGFNFGLCGFANVVDFVNAHRKSESEQLNAFCKFIQSSGLVPSLASKDWVTFAKRYNGPGYAQNRYDEKLKAAYIKCSGVVQCP